MAAELVVGAVLNVAFERLTSPEAINWIKGKKLDKKLDALKTTLYAAQAFLNDAENKQVRDAAVKDWLSDLKDAVYKAGDLLDEISTKAATQKDHPTGNFISRYLNLQDREMVAKIEDVSDTLDSILKHKDALGLREIPKEDMSWRVTTSLVKKPDVYGRDKDKDAIITLLLDDATDGEISVIPILGRGGIGKTTLAQWVYHEDVVKQNFDFRAWVCVSEEFDVVKVTKTIIEAITRGSCHTNDLNLLQHELKEKLTGRKFLVVLDDAWKEGGAEWNKLLEPFKDGVKGSKILVTARSKIVASSVQTVHPHELSLLSHEDCWLVFAKHALLSPDSIEYLTLEKIGREIVSKCHGLPLAAQTLGGLLRGNYDVRHWNHVLKSEIWEFPEDRSKIVPALRISYYYLPSSLKECFIYCSLYPKDYVFNKDELILLWMAEDLLQPSNRGRTLEEVGYEYFDELVSQSIFQPHSIVNNVFLMHDLMHDLATYYAGEFFFRAEELENAADISIKTRHLSHNAKGNYPISNILAACDRAKHTRTFLEVNLNSWDPFNMENAPCILISQLKYLRVLSFERFPLNDDSLPDSIGELIHLRYLDVSETDLVALPESVSKLYNLQTLKLSGCRKLNRLPSGMQDLVNLRYLDVSGTDLVALPESLSKLYNLQTLKLRYCYKLKRVPSGMQDLVNLRHLDIRGTYSLEEMPKGMSKLKHLQVLSDYIVGEHKDNGIGELGALANLRGSLSISKLENVVNSGQALEAKMADKTHINHLQFEWSTDGDTADSKTEKDILDKLRPHRDLKELRIEGYRGTLFPDWLGSSSYLGMTQLTLSRCMNCWMLPSLGQLPSLKQMEISDFDALKIIGADFFKNDGSCLVTPFPSLEILEFHEMSCWEKWHSSEFDAFPRLKELSISECPVLVGDLPNHLPTLETLAIEECKQLACSLPRTPRIINLSITGEHKVKMQEELPLSLRSLKVSGSQLVEWVLEAMTHTQLTCLQYLSISGCESEISFPWTCVPSSLQDLSIQHCKNLEFPMQQPCESLQSLTIDDSCHSLTSLPLDALPSLRSLSIYDCPNLEKFDLFPKWGLPPNLREVSVHNCEKLVRWLVSMDLHTHPLTTLHITGPCESVKSFPKEGCLPASLEYLYLCSIPSLETLDCKGLFHLTSLKVLYINNCPKLENISGERLPASLMKLKVLYINYSPLLGERCKTKDQLIWPKISHIPHIQVDDEWIW